MKNIFLKLALFALLTAVLSSAMISCGGSCGCVPNENVCDCDKGEAPENSGGSDETGGGTSDGSDEIGSGGVGYLPGVGDNDIPVVDLSAATRSVLSTVAIRATAEIEESNGYDFDSIVRDRTKAGSGIIYKLDRERGNAYILTNYHLLYDNDATSDDRLAHTVKIYLYGQEDEKYAIDASFVGGSLVYDFALLRVDGSEVLKKSHALEAVFADSEEIDILDPVLAVGDPEGLGMSVTTGMVCVDSEILEMTGSDNRRIYVRVMRIDVPINEGNSGGGLYNANGLLVGMVNAKRIGAEVDNIAYAFPSNLVKLLAENLLAHCDGTANRKLVKYDLGMTLVAKDMWLDIDEESGRIIKRERIMIEEMLLSSVFSGALRAGDVIRSITVNGEKTEVTRLHHITDTLLALRVGSRLEFEIERIGESGTVEVREFSIDITEDMKTNPDARK